MSSTILDLVGRRFGRLTVVARTGERKHANVVWECVCDCGETKNVPSPYLRNGKTTSCGCLRRELTIRKNQEREHELVERGPCIADDCAETAEVGLFCKPHYHRNWGARNVDKRRAIQRRSQMRRKYGLTDEGYASLVEKQSGVCAICKGPPNFRGLFVDHDHACCPGQQTCGKCTRGLLCNNCNFLIGLAKENRRTLLSAADYLGTWAVEVAS